MSYINPNKYYTFDFNKSHTGYDLATKDEIIRFSEKINIINKITEEIEKELGNVNTNENIIAKGICLKIKEIVGSDKD